MDSSCVVDRARGRALPHKKQFVLSLSIDLKLVRHIRSGKSARNIMSVRIFLNLYMRKKNT